MRNPYFKSDRSSGIGDIHFKQFILESRIRLISLILNLFRLFETYFR